MATIRKTEVSPKIKPATAAVQRYRARQAKQGGATIYCTVGKVAAQALDSIMMKRICSKREAVELALQRYAGDIGRKR
jgi:hypothetical protein